MAILYRKSIGYTDIQLVIALRSMTYMYFPKATEKSKTASPLLYKQNVVNHVCRQVRIPVPTSPST